VGVAGKARAHVVAGQAGGWQARRDERRVAKCSAAGVVAMGRPPNGSCGMGLASARSMVQPTMEGRTRAMDLHAEKRDRVVRQLQQHDPRRPLSLRKKAVSHLVPKPQDKRHDDDKIDLSDLDAILEIDVAARICTAEPGVTFEALVAATLRHGLVPIVVPELKTITVGGAVAGCSIESMSFVYGGFHDTCLAYEVITALGEVIQCTPDNEHRLVFQMMHGSFGTLGILSKLTFRLIPAKPFVHVVYERYERLADFQAAIWRRFIDRNVDFMDGIIHAPNLYVLSLGRFVADAPYASRYDWTKIYYQSTARREEDYLATPDYFFRYDQGVTNVHPKSRLGRLLFGRALGSSNVLRLAEKMRRFLPKRPGVTVDLFIPFSKADAFMRWYEADIGHFPLWCVPYRRVHDYEWLSSEFWKGVDDELFLDLAIYGMKQPDGRNIYREIEEALMRIGGTKTLISYNYYEEDEFWRIFHRDNHRAVKAITDPHDVFRDLYEKTCRAARGIEG
jgi:FAD/FMN-containing dehydrogenase